MTEKAHPADSELVPAELLHAWCTRNHVQLCRHVLTCNLTCTQPLGIPDGEPMRLVVWKHYTNATDVDVPLLSGGTWTVERDRLNDRGDEGTIEERAKSVAEVGIIENLRMGAWLVHCEEGVVLGPNARYTALLWARPIKRIICCSPPSSEAFAEQRSFR